MNAVVGALVLVVVLALFAYGVYRTVRSGRDVARTTRRWRDEGAPPQD